jgi:hypothetical protein
MDYHNILNHTCLDMKRRCIIRVKQYGIIIRQIAFMGSMQALLFYTTQLNRIISVTTPTFQEACPSISFNLEPVLDRSIHMSDIKYLPGLEGTVITKSATQSTHPVL